MRYRLLVLFCAFPLLLAGCIYEDATDESKNEQRSAESAPSQDDISVPDAGEIAYEPAALEQLRRDASWRAAAERDRAARAAALARPSAPTQPSPDLSTGQEPPAAPTPPSPPSGSPGAQPPLRAPAAAESFDQISPDTLSLEPRLPLARDGGGPTVLRVQILLDRARFSPGVIDGNWGQNTEKALFWFQHAKGLQATGEVDGPTWNALMQVGGNTESLRQATLTEEDLRGPFTELPDDVYARENLDCLCYESPLEMLAERSHSTPELLRQLNPQADFDRLAAGDPLWVPNVVDILAEQPSGEAAPPRQPSSGPAVAELLISKKGYYLQALDASGNILYHFPSTLGSKYDPSPSGAYKVTGTHPRPAFHYQPALLADVPDNEKNAQLPPGPNSPVGLVWMQLSKPHNGIHGTAVPETIGYASSHGCVRLTNWDAVFLSEQIQPGVQVRFVG